MIIKCEVPIFCGYSERGDAVVGGEVTTTYSMATPVHARMACPDSAKNPDGSGEQEGQDSSLKNGTTFEDSEDSGGSNIVVKNIGHGQHGSSRETSGMEQFQDGGGSTPQPNSRPASGMNVDSGYPVNMDRSRINSDFQNFNQSSSRDGVPNAMVNDDFRNSAPDGYNHGCDMGYTRSGYVGELGNASSDISTNSQPNKMYPQYNQPQMRPGFGQSPRNMAMGPQQRPSGSNMSRYPTSNSQQQQRFLLGPSISQQTGPTPTLNQLLQAPNSLQRYHNNYDYSSNQGLHKNMGEPNPQYPGPNSSWGNMRGSSGYPQPQQMTSTMYRNQSGPSPVSEPPIKRQYGVPPSGPVSSPTPGPSPQGSQQYPAQQGGSIPDPSMKRPYGGQLSSGSSGPSPQGSQYPPQQYHQYSQPSQGTAVRPPMGQSYPQQGVQQYSSGQQGSQSATTQQSTPGYDHQRQPSMPQYGAQSHMQQPQQTSISQQQSPQHHPQQQPSTQQHQQPPSSQLQPQPQQSSMPQQQSSMSQQQPSISQQSSISQQQASMSQQQPSISQQQSISQQPQPSMSQQQQSTLSQQQSSMAQQQSSMSQQQQPSMTQQSSVTQQQQQSSITQQQSSITQQQQPSMSQQPPSLSHQQTPQQLQQQPSVQQTSLQDVGGNNNNSSVGGSAGDDGPSSDPSSGAPSGRSITPGLRAPATPPHAVVSPHRPVPSPSGPPSVGSPSMSSSLGQQNIPMSPRPAPSSQPENAGQSPMSQPPMTASQAYNQQMAPPTMYGNKMHQGMLGQGSGTPVGPYSHQSSSGHYSQGSYHRAPNSMGMPNYSNQSQSSYGSPVPGATYSPQMNMPSHRMASHSSTTGSSGYTSPSPTAGYQNTQYGNSGAPPAPSSAYGMNNMMPPPNQYPKASTMPPPTGGAQAAAQAAVMAAAASSGGIRPSPVYLRQHLQQKMYPAGYSGSPLSPVPPGAPGSAAQMGADSSPMPPPSSTPQPQLMGMNQTSPMPPQASISGVIASGSNCDNSVPSSMTLAGFTQTSAPSVGPPQTTITQSISSPVPSAVTVSSPSIMGSDMMSSQQGRGPMGGPQGPLLPPPIMDEGSQASNASASSSLPEERVETPKPNSKPTMSHPPTPNTLSSPGAASMSSFHDEFESVSSPSWPRTPASPVINNQAYDHHPIKRPDGMLKLYDMSDDPERRVFLDKLIMYSEERGTPISQCPTISKQPLDLYRLYLACKERGGFVEVMKGKMWKDIAGIVGIGASSSAAYTLRKQYIKHLLPFECKYDRGGIDPGPLISSLESGGRKKNAAKNAMLNQEGYHQGGPMMDGYSSHYPGAYPPSAGPHPGMMPNADYPGHHPPYNDPMHPGGPVVNHSGSEGAMDPFSDDMPSSQYSQRHPSGDGYGYSQPSANSGMPPYSGNQSNMPPSAGQYGYNNAPVNQQEPYGDQYSNNMGPPAAEPGYGNRNVVSDPYAPPGGYPPNRTVGPTNPPTYPPYQGHCDQDRYDQPASQGPMMRPQQSNSGMGPAPQDSPGYAPHRYASPAMASRENMPAQQMGSYQGRPPMPQSQYQGHNQPPSQTNYPQSQQDTYRGNDYPPQMSRLQSTLIQRLQPKNHTIQAYPPSNQQGMYGQNMPPPNKVAPQSNVPGNMYQRDMYSMGPKRHGDFSKPHGPAQDQYHMGSYPQQQTQGPYTDRAQYSYRPTHGVPPPSGPQPGWTRDNRPYASGPNQYPPSHRDGGWDVSRHSEGPPTGGGAWPRYNGPQQEPYPPHMGPSMGQKMALTRGYMSPSKMPPHPGVGPPPQYAPSSARKEVVFPPDSVEGVAPVMTKRRRLLSKDMSAIDPWRLMMALKSGLLCESTWALDILSVLICDDATVLYFGLSHMPGLLEVLMDHYRRCLNLVFDLLGDLEVGFSSAGPTKDPKMKAEQKWYELDRDIYTIDENVDHSEEVLCGSNTKVLDSENFTQKSRCRKLVKTQQEEALFLFDPDKKWDTYEGFISGSSHWLHGGGESTLYIQTHFENDEKNVRFARIMQDVKKCTVKKETEEQSQINEEQETCPKQTVPCENGVYCVKKECSSDTEEDESLCVNAPSPKTESKSQEPKKANSKEQNEADKGSVKDSSSDKEVETVQVNSVKDIKSDSAEKDTSNPVTDKDETSNPVTDKDETSNPVTDKDESSNLVTDKDEKITEKPADTEDESFPKVRCAVRKRKTMEEMEDEAYNRDEPSLCITTDAQDSLTRRCICISSLLRNLSFVPGNDTEMSKHAGFLMVMGRLLLLNHVHSPRKPPQRHYDREEENESTSVADSCSSLSCDNEWWWDMLHLLRENTLVTLANIAGQLDLAPFPEEISFPLLDGLMHWVTCPSSYAQDPLPTQPCQSVLSPQRLSLEALCKLSVLESNVDLMMATPPWQRINRFFSLLAKWLSRNEDQVLREFSVVLLSNLSQADSSMARAIALQGTCIPLLITFVEQAEQSALQVANSQGINALRENPELMGTTLDMVRRAAGTLRCLARVPSNRTLFLQHQQRLLALVMSQILDQGVASIIADVLFECSQDIIDDLSCTTIAYKPSALLSPAVVT